MRKFLVWVAATLWFAWVSGLSAYGVVTSRESLRIREHWRCEFYAISQLRSYLGAQGTFQRLDRYGKGELRYANPIDGKGFPDLYRVGGPLPENVGPDGTEIKALDLAFARATSPAAAKDGYWYVDIVADKEAGPYDFTKDCGLCAVPALYGQTGIHTYIIDLCGTVYKKDNGGTPVTVWPGLAEKGWRPVGE